MIRILGMAAALLGACLAGLPSAVLTLSPKRPKKILDMPTANAHIKWKDYKLGLDFRL